MKTFWLVSIPIIFYLCPEYAISQEDAETTVSNFFSKIPADTIAWVLLTLGILNGISEVLEKLETVLKNYAHRTANTVDDKFLSFLVKFTDVLQGFLKFVQKFVDFFAAKKNLKK